MFGSVIFIWGLNFVFVQLGEPFSPPIWLSFLRAIAGFSGAVVLLILLKTKGRLSLKQKIEAFLIGIVGAGFFFAFWLLGEQTIPAGETSVLIYTFPILTLLLSFPLLGDRPSTLKIGAVLLGFAGIMLVSKVGVAGWNADIVPIVFLIISAFSFALDTVLFKRFFRGEELLRANVWQLGGATVFLLVWALASEPFQAIHWTIDLYATIAWIGILGTAVVYVIYFTLLSKYNASSLTAYLFLVVITALVASFFIFGEKIDLMQGLGVAAVVASIYLTNRTGSARNGAQSEKSQHQKEAKNEQFRNPK
jgi:drug/metabolite transporter (DMT)-like permease